MLHLVGIVVVTAAGMAAANLDEWPKVKKKAAAYARKIIQAVKVEEDAPESPLVSNHAAASNALVKAKSDTEFLTPQQIHAKLVTALETQGTPYRFALSTATVGLMLAARLGAPWLTPVGLLLTGFLASPIFERALTAVFREKKARVDVVDAAGLSFCLLYGKFAIAATMVWLLILGEALLDRARRRSYQSLTKIFGEQAHTAWIVIDEAEVEVPVGSLKKDDVIVVKTGEQIPVDGVIQAGEGLIDQQRLTGEAAPAEKHAGDEVFAMTVVMAGQITVTVRETGEETLAARIVHIINDASQQKMPLQSAGEQIADSMVIPTLGLGAVGFATTGSNAMLAILNADYGTGIRVAAPIALLGALGSAAKHGVLIKDSKVFQLLSKTDVVLFDKTGTLTCEVPTVSNIIPAAGTYTQETILAYTAAVEQHFTHPIAKAILQKAYQSRVTLPAYDESRYDVGMGITAVIDHNQVHVGSRRYMERAGISIPPGIQDTLEDVQNQGNTAILTAIDYQVAGLLEIQATLRDEALRVIRDLRRRGMQEIVLISGDHEAPTRDFARQIQADRYFAGVLPHEKAAYVRSLQKNGKTVMMVGDGINDSAALSSADISVSLQGASTVAMDVADVVFMDGNLEKFDDLYTYADLLTRNISRSFQLIAIPNTLCIAGALLGFFGLGSSLVLNNGFNLLAALNGTHLYAEAEEKR